MTLKAEKEARRLEAIEYLRKALRPVGQPRKIDSHRLASRPCSTVYTEVIHVARSGMRRHVRVYAVIDGEIQGITWYVAKALDQPLARKGNHAIVVGGCGFNTCLKLLERLNHVLYPGSRLSQGGSTYRHASEAARPFRLIWRDL